MRKIKQPKTMTCFRCGKRRLAFKLLVKASKRMEIQFFEIKNHKPCGPVVFSVPE